MCNSNFSRGKNTIYIIEILISTKYQEELILMELNVKDTKCACISEHKLFKLCCQHLSS